MVECSFLEKLTFIKQPVPQPAQSKANSHGKAKMQGNILIKTCESMGFFNMP